MDEVMVGCPTKDHYESDDLNPDSWNFMLLKLAMKSQTVFTWKTSHLRMITKTPTTGMKQP